MPERKGIELYDSLPNFHSNKAIINAVLSSLIWREERTIDSHLDTYFAEFVSNEQFRDRFIRTVIEVAFNPGNYYNADYLHKMLEPMRLADRDAMWTPTLYRIYSNQDEIIKDIINWAWDESDKVNMDEESAELGATLLSWFWQVPIDNYAIQRQKPSYNFCIIGCRYLYHFWKSSQK